MPQHSAPVPGALAALLAAVAAATPLSAQRTLVGIDVNAASETDADRAPHLFASAGVAPRRQLGVSVHGAASRIEYDVTLDETGTRGLATSSGYRTSASAYYGLTSRVTIGAFISGVQGVRTSPEHEFIIDPHAGNIPTRQGTRTPIGGAELGVNVRGNFWRSTSGASAFSAMVGMADADDTDLLTTLALAARHRVGRVTLHVAPMLRLEDGVVQGGANGVNAVGRVGAAASVAATRRLGFSLEWLREGIENGATDAALGARLRLGRLAVDAGVRTLIRHETGERDVSRHGAMLATHFLF